MTRLIYQRIYGGVRLAGGGYKPLRQGDTVPENVDPEHLKRYLRIGAVADRAPAPPPDIHPDRLPTPGPGHEAAFEQEPVEPIEPPKMPPAPGASAESPIVGMSDVELVAYIRDNELKPKATVELAAGDPGLAQRVLQAETEALDGKPRDWVADRLRAIVEATDAPGSGGSNDAS